MARKKRGNPKNISLKKEPRLQENYFKKIIRSNENINQTIAMVKRSLDKMKKVKSFVALELAEIDDFDLIPRVIIEII